MEEDITILTAFLLSNIPEIITQEEFDEVKQAIENLIKGYRELEKHIAFYEKHGSYKARILELEESLDNSRKANELLNKTNNELRLEIRTTYSKVVNDIISKFNLGDDYIPKSKVEEKIEELDRKIEFLNSQLTKCYEEREKLGTETEIDDNEELIFNLENLKDEAWAQRQVLTEITYGG